MASKTAQAKKIRRENASRDYQYACEWAAQYDLYLKQCSDIHYQLIGDEGWLINLYPTTLVVHHGPQFRPPRITLPANWRLYDVVEAAVRGRIAKW